MRRPAARVTARPAGSARDRHPEARPGSRNRPRAGRRRDAQPGRAAPGGAAGPPRPPSRRPRGTGPARRGRDRPSCPGASRPAPFHRDCARPVSRPGGHRGPRRPGRTRTPPHPPRPATTRGHCRNPLLQAHRDMEDPPLIPPTWAPPGNPATPSVPRQHHRRPARPRRPSPPVSAARGFTVKRVQGGPAVAPDVTAGAEGTADFGRRDSGAAQARGS